jgi:DNA-directed RNA polymerase sigma subunit (sigma70/sigma32)
VKLTPEQALRRKLRALDMLKRGLTRAQVARRLKLTTRRLRQLLAEWGGGRASRAS